MFVFKPASLLISASALSQATPSPPSLLLYLLPSPESRWTEYIGLRQQQQQTLTAPNENSASGARTHASTAWLFTKPSTTELGSEGVNKGGAEGEREITLSRTHSLTLGPEQSDLQLRVCVCVGV